ncbi:MAG: sugar ABC transporter ATP-binding protein [bacterium]|nr:sugar ABC transporter ATP-binding protein [bacterium]
MPPKAHVELPPEAHVELKGVTKRFGGTLALDGVDVAVRAGAVHAIVGENGAGKSTAGKIVAGVLAPDAGKLLLHGAAVAFRTPRAALAAGITMVAQELSLVPSRSVAENVFLGIESHRGPFALAAADRFAGLVEEHGIELAPNAIVGRLTVADQQKVEILRALARRAELIVMDEPTARLTTEQAVALRRTVRALTSRGVTVVYVSHFLDEVLAVADDVTILRDGRVIRSGPAAGETRRSLIEGIVGRDIEAAFPPRRRAPPSAPAVLQVRELSRAAVFGDVSFEVRAGEIVTLAGLVGSGRSEVLRCIFGADRATAGNMTLDGQSYAPRSPRQAVGSGVAMVPESRKAQGLLPRRSVRENVALPHLGRFITLGGFVRSRSERAAAGRVTRAVGLTGATIASVMAELSGGNQQKSLFARWLVQRPRLFLADEPTRGVDVGAKRGIYDVLAGLAGEGMAVLVVSSELEEVLGLAHRILVMRAGRLVGELDGAAATRTEVMELAFGSAA